HQQILNKCRVAGALRDPELSNERILDGKGTYQDKQTPGHEGAVGECCRPLPRSLEILPAKLEVGVENADIEQKPDGIEDILDGDPVDAKAEKRIERFPGEIQRQGIKRDCVGFIAET